MDTKPKKYVYVAYTNSDCTEGRGYDIPIAACEIEATAIRYAQHKYVQGSDGPVRKLEVINIDNKFYYPSAAINIVKPIDIDIKAQYSIDKYRETLDKAKKLGLSDADISNLKLR